MAVASIATTTRIVHITWTRAAKIRMTANVDMPEYGIRKDETFYLVRSSANDGTYYIVQWQYAEKAWACGCKWSTERPHAHPCRHRKMASDDCRARRDARKVQAAKLHKDINTFLASERKERHITDIERRLTVAGLMRR